MAKVRLAVIAALVAVLGGMGWAEDLDVRALQAKLAEQEARLNDLQAKMGPGSTSAFGMAAAAEPTTPEALLSRNKNAVVKIGGLINTRYFYRDYKYEGYAPMTDRDGDTGLVPVRGGDWTEPVPGGKTWGANWPVGTRDVYGSVWDPTQYRTLDHYKGGDLYVSDANLEIDILVNDYFDAHFTVDLQGSGNTAADNAKRAWVRWKNVCNSGFGVLVGRNDLVFGSSSADTGGVLTAWTGDPYDVEAPNYLENWSIFPWIGWDHSRTTQVTPYWESQDGKFKVEVSFMQTIDNMFARGNRTASYTGPDGVAHSRTVNDGLGSMSARITASPIEGLNLSVSAINMYNKLTNDPVYLPNGWWLAPGSDGNPGWTGGDLSYAVPPWGNKNNSAIDLAFDWRPSSFNKLKLWTQWVHNWNAGWMDSLSVDVLTYGASYDFTDRFTFFAQGDYLNGRLDNDRISQDASSSLFGVKKQQGWAAYFGVRYTMPYGVNLEAGWRHEQITSKNRAGETLNKVKGDSIYGHLGFEF